MDHAEGGQGTIAAMQKLGVAAARRYNGVGRVETPQIALLLPFPLGGEGCAAHRLPPRHDAGMRDHDDGISSAQPAGERRQVEVEKIDCMLVGQPFERRGNAAEAGLVGCHPVERFVDPGELAQPAGLGYLEGPRARPEPGKHHVDAERAQGVGEFHGVAPDAADCV